MTMVFAVLLLSSFVALVGSGPVDAQHLVGVQVDNPQWEGRERQDAIIAELKTVGVTSIRIPMVEQPGLGFENSLDFVRRAFRAGIRTHLIIGPQYPPGTPTRAPASDTEAKWPEFPMSAADPDVFRAKIGPVIAGLDEAGIALAGIELGNEINWSPFNGDFAVPGRGRVLRRAELDEDPQGRSIAAGFRAYLKTLAVLKEIRDRSGTNARTPIVLAGLASTSASWPSPASRLDAVDLRTTIRYLQDEGVDDLVDAYGVHTYVGTDVSAADRARHLQGEVFAECAPPDARVGKPCWLTEWGLTTPEACPVVDRERAAAAQDYLADFSAYITSGRLQALFWYTWSGAGQVTALYRCGGLTETGRIVLTPATR